MTMRRMMAWACGGLLLLLGGARAQAAEAAYPPAYAELLGRYVATGGVRYAAWKASATDVAALRVVTEHYAGGKPPADRGVSLAWHLNAYNAWVLRLMIERYPVAGPLAGTPRFFDERRIRVAGEEMSLNDLETGRIRKGFQEPRIHFALNCASRSCPPLHGKPFDAADLDATLTSLTRAFLDGNPEAVRVEGGKVRVTRLFEWYAEDFGGLSRAAEYINRYRTKPIPAGKLEFLEYNWSLNEVP
jgi:hypothetical protein